jgi:glutamate synthase (NADPH) small chain
VLGGGDTAMDCVRSAVRQGAKSVTCVYRRDKASMPGSRQEVTNAIEEGVKFVFNQQPIAIKHHNGQVTAVEFAESAGALDPVTGRQNFQVDNNKISEIEADSVILAFGFTASPATWFEQLGLNLKSNGLVQTAVSPDPELPYSQQTDNPKVFAGGDMVRGADLVVTAIAEGRQAAREIMHRLLGY